MLSEVEASQGIAIEPQRGSIMLNRCVARSGTCGQSPPQGLDLEGVEPLPLCLLFDPAGVGIAGDIGYRG